MDPLMVLMMESLSDYCLETHWDLLMIKCLALIDASNWYIMMVKCLELYLKIYMESYLGLML